MFLDKIIAPNFAAKCQRCLPNAMITEDDQLSPLQIQEWLSSTSYDLKNKYKLAEIWIEITYRSENWLICLFFSVRKWGWRRTFFRGIFLDFWSGPRPRKKYEWYPNPGTNVHKTKLSSWYRRFWLNQPFRNLTENRGKREGTHLFGRRRFISVFTRQSQTWWMLCRLAKREIPFNSDSDAFYCPWKSLKT